MNYTNRGITLYLHFLLFISLLIVPTSIFAQGKSLWLSAGQNIDNTREAFTESKITPTNVSQLQVRWVLNTEGDISATPAVDDNYVYVPDWAGNIYKIDANTGAVIWNKQVKDFTGQNFNFSRTTPLITDNMVIFGTQLGDPVGIGATLISLDKDTGELIWMTQLDDHFASIVTQSAVAFGNKIYVGVSSAEEYIAADQNYPCCSFRGSVVALDRDTGAILWKTYTAPDPALGFSGNAVWGSTPVIDPKRKSVYVTTGNNYTVPDDVLDCVANGGTAEEIKACIESVVGSSNNYFDAIVSMDLKTGAIKWARSVIPFDAWTAACLFYNDGNCPDPAGGNYDFAQGPMLFRTKLNGKKNELLGAGQKSGLFWTLDPDNGNVVWVTQVGPGGELGGLQWGSATDGDRIYTAVSNSNFQSHTLVSGSTIYGGYWSALKNSTGEIVWETAGTGLAIPIPWLNQPPPNALATNQGPVTVANGVVFAGAMDAVGTMYAMDAATGNILWSFESGGSVNSGAAVVNGIVYWGSGYSNLGIGTPNNKLYAFQLPLAKSKSNGTDAGFTADRFYLSQNYPNPFNPSTVINFSIPKENTMVSLKIFNSIGQEVAVLINQVVSAGNHEVQFDATGLPSGLYFYTLNTSDFVETRKMLLLK
jgi:polyvinyl alcohol dehydrogenase (cytochrome)